MDNILVRNTIASLLKISEEQQSQRLRFFARESIENRLLIMSISKESFYPLKQEHKDIALNILSYVSLLIAISKYGQKINKVDENLTSMRSKSLRKQNKREKLFGYWAIIKELRNIKKLSFREIAQYLKKYHKLDVAHSTIYQMWSELETIKINKNGEK